MNLPVIPRSIAELCADSRTVPLLAGGMHLHTLDKLGLEDDPHLLEADTRPRLPHLTSLSYGPGDLGTRLTERFLDRQPLPALDLMGYRPLPSLDPHLDLADLGERADALGLFVEIPVADLMPPTAGRALPQAPHRVVWLDHNGQITTPANASTVRVLPSYARADGAYDDVDAALADLIGKQHQPSGHIVFGRDGVTLGWHPGLVAHWFGPALTPLGRWLDNDDVAAAVAAGAGTVTVDGYVDLLRRMEWAPPDSQGLVQVEDEAGGAHVFLAHRGENGVSFLDPGTNGAARLPRDPASVRFTALPGAMSLAGRITALRAAGAGATRPGLDIRLPAGAHVYRPADGSPDTPVVVLGDPAAEPPSMLDMLHREAPRIGQPIVVLGAGRGDAGLRSLLLQFGWNDKVPVVVTRASGTGKELTAALDTFTAPLVHQITAGMAKAAGTTVSSMLGNLWTVRLPRPPATPPPITESLGPDLLRHAAGQGGVPAFGRPPRQVTDYLHTPVTALVGPQPPIDLHGPEVKKLRPLVEQIVATGRAFAAQGAALHLAATVGPDMVTGYLADPADRGGKLFRPMLGVPGETPAARRAAVEDLLPHLVALSGGDVADMASHVVLNAIMAKFEGTMKDADIKNAIWGSAAHLSGRIKGDYARLVSDLKSRLPEQDGAAFDDMARWLLDCPEPAA